MSLLFTLGYVGEQKVTLDLSEIKNLLIVGTTMSGKTNLICNILDELASTIETIIFDPKMVEYYNYQDKCHYINSVEEFEKQLNGITGPKMIVIDEFYEIVSYDKNFENRIYELLAQDDLHFIISTQHLSKTGVKQSLIDSIKNRVATRINIKDFSKYVVGNDNAIKTKMGQLIYNQMNNSFVDVVYNKNN